MWHHSQCIASECACCGWKPFWLCLWVFNTNDLIKWHKIGYEVVGHTEEGKEKKVSKIEFHETPPKESISYLKP
jgi:hypothetical protein